MKKSFKQYKNDREDEFHSHNIIIDNISAGYGGTTHWNEIMLNNNLSNITLVNSHRLQYENVRAIWDERIKAPEDTVINVLHGKTYLVPEPIQNEFGYPPCFCDLFKDNPKLFELMQKGYMPPDWCKEHCPSGWFCEHKAQFPEAWLNARSSYKWNDSVLWDLPKAYNMSVVGNETNMVDGIMDTFKNTNLFYDENPLNYIYRESKFTDWQLRIFKEFISRKILALDSSLYELWKDFIPLIDCIYNNIQIGVPDSMSAKDLKQKIETFYNSYRSKDFKRWCGRVLHLMYSHKISAKIYNPLNSFIDIISDMYKHKDEELKCVMFGRTNDGEAHNFSYYIDQRDIIRSNIKHASKFILRSGYSRFEKMWNYLFPEYDDYGILKSTDEEANCYFNRYWRYTKGAFAKFILYQKDFRKHFYKLADFCKEIIDLPLIKPQKILIILFQKGVKELLKKYFSRSVYPNLSFEYWYNLEGTNVYLDCTGVILFGCAGKPGKVDRILGELLGVPLELMMNWSIQGEMNQGMLRIRPNMFPNLKWCIGLTKVVPNGITKYTNFNRADDIVLIPYLVEKKKANSNEILKDVYNNELGIKPLQRKLTTLYNSGLLDRERKSKREKYYYSLRKDY